MAKRHSSNRPDSDGFEWLEGQLDNAPLDPESLAAMPLRDVKSQLKKLGASDTRSFVEALNARLPDGADIELEEPKRRTRADRDPRPHARIHKWRPLGWRSIAATLLILVSISVVLPYVLKERQNITVETSRARAFIDALDWGNLADSAVVGPASEDMIYGIRYVVSDFPGRLPLLDALPEYQDSMVAYFEMEIEIDASGNVVALDPVNITTQEFGDEVIQAVLAWQFDAVDAATPNQRGNVKIVYEAE